MHLFYFLICIRVKKFANSWTTWKFRCAHEVANDKNEKSEKDWSLDFESQQNVKTGYQFEN